MSGWTRRALIGAGLAAGASACAGREGRVTLWAMGSEGAGARALLPPSVDVQTLPWAAAHAKLLTAFAGRSLPDVAQIGNTWLAELVAVGALAPLPDAARDLLSDQFPAVVDTNMIDGRAYGVPWYVDARLQFYRTDLFARAGYSALPETWAEWKRALARVRRPGGYAVLLPLDEFEQLLTFALQTPEPLLRDRGTRGNFSNGGFVEALRFYKSLFDEGLAPVVTAGQVANIWMEFARGLFALFVSGPWTVGELRRRLPGLEGQWRTAPMPGPAGPGASAPGGSSLVVFRGARDPAAAWDAVRHLARPPVQARFFALTGDLPARRSAWAAPALAADSNLASFAAQLSRARAVPKVPEWERIATEMQRVAERMVRGEFTPEAAAREIDRRADRLLEKRRWMLERRG